MAESYAHGERVVDNCAYLQNRFFFLACQRVGVYSALETYTYTYTYTDIIQNFFELGITTNIIRLPSCCLFSNLSGQIPSSSPQSSSKPPLRPQQPRQQRSRPSPSCSNRSRHLLRSSGTLNWAVWHTPPIQRRNRQCSAI